MRLSGEWEYPNEDTKKFDTDVAVMRFIPNRDDFVYKALPSYSLIRKDRVAVELFQRELGVGEDLAISGLFHAHYGKQRNRPIVRFGTIAAKLVTPEEIDRLNREAGMDAVTVWPDFLGESDE